VHSHDHAHVHSHEHPDDHEHADTMNDSAHDHWHDGSFEDEHAHTEKAAGVMDLSKESHPELPDAAFACIDSTGRHYPHHTNAVKNGSDNGTVNKALLRNALSRIGDPSNTQCGKAHLEAHAKALGIGQEKSWREAVLASHRIEDFTPAQAAILLAQDSAGDAPLQAQNFTHEHGHAHGHDGMHAHDDGEMHHDHDHTHIHDHAHDHGPTSDHPHDEAMNHAGHDHDHDGATEDHAHSDSAGTTAGQDTSGYADADGAAGDTSTSSRRQKDASQDAPTSSTGDEGTAILTAAAGSLDAQRSLNDALIAKVSDLTSERDAAIRERDEARDMAEAALKQAAATLDRVKNLPAGRRAVVREAASGLESLRDVFDPEAMKVLERSAQK
jgi:hypothetical protein